MMLRKIKLKKNATPENYFCQLLSEASEAENSDQLKASILTLIKI